MMQDRFYKTETSFPLYKAYNTYENPKQTYDERLNQHEGPNAPKDMHAAFKTNSFTEYKHSGRVGPDQKREEILDQINSIAHRVAAAKANKGTLCLNDAKNNGGSFKVPALDVALNSKAGFRGGETGQRFYMKFPIYRTRGHGNPDVKDDIQKIWD